MRKSSTVSEHDAALRSSADAIIAPALAIKEPPAKDKALGLARLILTGAPHFGASEVQDAEIQRVLEAEGIGLPTFKKALSVARKELVKKPRAVAPRTKRQIQSTSAATPITQAYPARVSSGNEATYVENVPASLL